MRVNIWKRVASLDCDDLFWLMGIYVLGPCLSIYILWNIWMQILQHTRTQTSSHIGVTLGFRVLGWGLKREASRFRSAKRSLDSATARPLSSPVVSRNRRKNRTTPYAKEFVLQGLGFRVPW